MTQVANIDGENVNTSPYDHVTVTLCKMETPRKTPHTLNWWSLCNVHTVYTVEKAGGKCLPCVVDIRDDSQLESAVNSAVDKFGGIDIVVNNASAIHLSHTVDTPMKRCVRKRSSID